MTAVDRDYVLRVMNQAYGVQEKRALVYTKQASTSLVLTAETRSYTVALLIDAINAGLLEQLHDRAQQDLFTDATGPLLPDPGEPLHSIDENTGVGPDLPDEMFDVADDYERLTMDEIEDGA